MKEDLFFLGIKAIIRNNNGEILIIKQNPANALGTSGGYWDLPGGRIHKGDTIKKTIKREVGEETGILGTKIKELFYCFKTDARLYPKGGDYGLVLFIYLCEAKDISNIKLSHEHTEYCWVKPKGAAKLFGKRLPKEFLEKVANLEA